MKNPEEELLAHLRTIRKDERSRVIGMMLRVIGTIVREENDSRTDTVPEPQAWQLRSCRN